jgi:hypothetical protein
MPQPLPNAVPLPGGRVGHDVYDIIRALKEHDQINITWGDKGMLSGNPFVRYPRVLALDVSNEKQAWAIDAAKRAVSVGDDQAAYMALMELAVAAPH